MIGWSFFFLLVWAITVSAALQSYSTNLNISYLQWPEPFFFVNIQLINWAEEWHGNWTLQYSSSGTFLFEITHRQAHRQAHSLTLNKKEWKEDWRDNIPGFMNDFLLSGVPYFATFTRTPLLKPGIFYLEWSHALLWWQFIFFFQQ